jgi:hypothetical protein
MTLARSRRERVPYPVGCSATVICCAATKRFLFGSATCASGDERAGVGVRLVDDPKSVLHPSDVVDAVAAEDAVVA